MDDPYANFVYKQFEKNSWEGEVKPFIENLQLLPNKIWYASHPTLRKKVHQELISFGFYVKYNETVGESAIFYLNKNDDEVDGFLFEGEKRESVQIVSAFYEKNEAIGDRSLMSGTDMTGTVWEGDWLDQLQERIKERVHKKHGKSYVPVDTLLVALKNHFIWTAKKERPDIMKMMEEFVRTTLMKSSFKKIVIVDSDLVGHGDIYVIP